MKKTIKNGLLIVSTIIVSFVLFQSAFGQQDFGSINGTVKDPNDAVVAGATVKAVNTATNVEKTTTSDSQGYYQFNGMIPGEYSITVNAGNFKAFTTKAQVSVAGTKTVDLKMGIDVNVNVVDVPAGTGGLAEINTTDQTQSVVVSQRQMQGLPSQDRNPYGLVQLSGNISNADPSGRGVGPSINGQRSASTNILLDGTENVATFTATVSQTVSADAVSEFRVTTSNFSAEFGRASGGIINVITKGGGNRFAGSAFTQNRNSILSSNGYDNNANGLSRPHYNRNQFGGAVGGPIKKNKLFFFDALEFTRVRSSAPIIAWVPTPGFIAASAANTQAFFAAYGTLAATPNGVTTTIDPVATGTPACGASLATSVCSFRQVVYNAPVDAGGGTPQNSWNNAARVDWNVSNKTTMFFSYKVERDIFPLGTSATSAWKGYTEGATTFNQNFQVSGTHTFSSNLIFDGKFSYRRARGGVTLGGANPNTPTLYFYDQALPSIAGRCIQFPGYLPCSPGAGLNAPELERLIDVKPNMTWIRGNHNVRVGGQYIHLNDDVTFGAYQNASEGLSGGNLSQALSNFLSGTTVRHQVAVDPQGQVPGGTVTLPVKAPNFRRTNLYNEFAIYGMDSWRVTPTLTLNLGVRYEYYGVQKSQQGLDSNFYFGTGSNIFQQIRNGRIGIASAKGGLWKPGKAWAPRIGFAWDIGGDGKTSLRGGYGIGYERNFGNVTFNVIQNPPYYAVLVAAGTVTTNNFGPLAASSGTRILPSSSLRAVDPNIKQAFAHQWGVSFERQLGRNTVAKIDYSGSAGRNLYSISNINRRGTGPVYLGSNAVPGTDCPTGLPASNNTRLNCGFGNINFRGSDGTSNYYSFTPSIESSNFMGTGMILTARYTYSKAKDNLSSVFSESGNNFNLGYTDPFNPMLDYGPADFDVRHRFIGSVIYPIRFKSDNHLTNAIFGDWDVSAIVNIAGAAPFTVWDATNFNITSVRRMANGGQIINNGTRVQSGTANLFDYLVINNAPSVGTDPFGNNETGPFPSNMSTRNSFRGFGSWNANMSLYKNIPLMERYKLQFRVDVFNVFNHANTFVDAGNAYVFDPTFSGGPASGVVQAFKRGNRTAQVSARFTF